MKRPIRSTVAAVVTGLCLAVQSQGAAYVKFGDIKGESQDKGHEGWSDLASFSQGLTRPGGGTSGQSRRRGDVILEDIVCTKELDKASPKLAESVCKGTVFPNVEIQVTASGDQTSLLPYFTYELTNVMVVSQLVVYNEGSERPVEQLSLNFTAIKVTYVSEDNEVVEFSWGPGL